MVKIGEKRKKKVQNASKRSKFHALLVGAEFDSALY